MVVVNRLKEFQTLVAEQSKKSNKFNEIFNVPIDESNENTKFINKNEESITTFLNNVETIKKQLNELKICLNNAKKIYSDILITPNANSKLVINLNENANKFKNLSNIIMEKIKELNKEAALTSKLKDTKARIKSNQVMVLNKTLIETLEEFHNEQNKYREKCISKINLYNSIAGLKTQNEDIEKAIESGKFYDTVEIVMGERDKNALFMDVKLRHDEIIQLEASIRELHDMFQDMAMLIESQGEMLNNIESNVNTAQDYADKAFEKINCAIQRKKRNIKLKICLLIGLIIAIFILFSVGGAIFCFYLPFMCR